MSTILKVNNGSGPARMCNALCHNAKQAYCGCVCGGAYHGAGEQLALVRLTADFADGLWSDADYVDPAARQMSLGL